MNHQESTTKPQDARERPLNSLQSPAPDYFNEIWDIRRVREEFSHKKPLDDNERSLEADQLGNKPINDNRSEKGNTSRNTSRDLLKYYYEGLREQGERERRPLRFKHTQDLDPTVKGPKKNAVMEYILTTPIQRADDELRMEVKIKDSQITSKVIRNTQLRAQKLELVTAQEKTTKLNQQIEIMSTKLATQEKKLIDQQTQHSQQISALKKESEEESLQIMDLKVKLRAKEIEINKQRSQISHLDSNFSRRKRT
ncbi:MAG: hypothetical protein Q9220_007668 [cf. Caloplaca sp. 1 TL-2023]